MGHSAAQRMDRMYRFQRHIYDATRRHYLLGRQTLINGLVPPPGGTVLEIGCGTGWNLIEIARKYPDAMLYGFDVSEVMLETASRKVAKAGLQNRITLAVGDATAFSGTGIFGVRSFDRVVASYVLSMIPDWTAAMARSPRIWRRVGLSILLTSEQRQDCRLRSEPVYTRGWMRLMLRRARPLMSRFIAWRAASA